jgi:hypothetical protein
MNNIILYLAYIIIVLIGVWLYYYYTSNNTTGYNKEENNKNQQREGFDNFGVEDDFLKSEETYFKSRLAGPFVPGQEEAERFIKFDISKPDGQQIVSPILEEQQRQEESNVDINVQKCKSLNSCDQLDGTNCGYCFYNNSFFYGDEKGPLTDVCPNGWVKTKEQCVERRERAVCDKVTSCHQMIGDAAICGWCPTKNKAFVAQKDTSGKLVPKYSSDKCDDPDLMTGEQLGLVSASECTAFEKDHPCIGPNENTGPHSMECLSKLWKSGGCSSKGSANPENHTTAQNAWWNQRGWKSVFSDMKAWKTDADSTNWSLAKGHHKGCYGTDPDPCDPKYTPRPTECLQKLFLESGCNEKGKLYNELQNDNNLKNMSRPDLQNYFKTLVENTRSTEYSIKADANMKCFGIQVQAPPPIKVGDKVKLLINYPSWGNNTELNGIVAEISNGKAKVFWELIISADKTNHITRSAHLNDLNLLYDWLGLYAGQVPKNLIGIVKPEIDVHDLHLLESCKTDTSCPDAGCSLQLIMAVSYLPKVEYNVSQSQIGDVLMRIRNKYPGTQIADKSDIQYLVNSGLPYCFCGWSNVNGGYLKLYPSTEATIKGCGSGNRTVISCGTQGNGGVYIRITANPSNVINELKSVGIAGAVVAIVGKNEFVSLTTDGVIVHEDKNPQNYEMYGPWIHNSRDGITVQRIVQEGNTTVYIIQDGVNTKIVKETNGVQNGFYYVGNINEYGTKSLISVPKGDYNIRQK